MGGENLSAEWQEEACAVKVVKGDEGTLSEESAGEFGSGRCRGGGSSGKMVPPGGGAAAFVKKPKGEVEISA